MWSACPDIFCLPDVIASTGGCTCSTTDVQALVVVVKVLSLPCLLVVEYLVRDVADVIASFTMQSL